MREKADPCINCGQPSAKLCDFCIGWPIAGYVRVGRPSENRFRAVTGRGDDPEAPFPLPFTCDAPLCESCTKQIGMRFACGKDGGHDSVDRCPQHAGTPGGERIVPMTEAEANAIRRDVWAKYRRQQFSRVG